MSRNFSTLFRQQSTKQIYNVKKVEGKRKNNVMFAQVGVTFHFHITSQTRGVVLGIGGGVKVLEAQCYRQ